MINNNIQNDSYWYTEKDSNDEEIVKAMCVECHKLKLKELKTNTFGWYWSKSKGYGDYDLKCSVCESDIYLRGKDE